uniref:Ubiquitin-like protease family profile domain-containing protein n=1 Tax=Daucus carota subsp. sativus TaxID=79200 RepID=A0A169WNP9_DAUCS
MISVSTSTYQTSICPTEAAIANDEEFDNSYLSVELQNDSDEWLALQVERGKKSSVHDDMEKSDTSEYQPTDQEESEALQTDDELLETSDEDQLISTMRDKILKKKGKAESSTGAKKRKEKGKAKAKESQKGKQRQDEDEDEDDEDDEEDIKKPGMGKGSSNNYFCGPLVFLILFYVDRVWIKIETEVVRTIPRFTAWSDKDLRARERKETSENLFGKGRIRSADESTEQTQEVDRNLDEERKREQMIVELENLAFILVESRKQFDAANRQFNKCLKSCIDYNTVNNNEEFLTRVEAAQVFVCSEADQFENQSRQQEKETDGASQYNFEPLGNPVSEEREVQAEKQAEEERQVEKERNIQEVEEEREVESEKGADGVQKEIEKERPVEKTVSPVQSSKEIEQEKPVEKTVSPVQSSKEIEQEKPVENTVSPVQSSMGSEVIRMLDAAEKDYQEKIRAQEMASNVNVVGIATEAVSGLHDERTSDTEMPVAEHGADKEEAVEEQAAPEALDVSSRKAAQLVKKDGKKVKIIFNTSRRMNVVSSTVPPPQKLTIKTTAQPNVQSSGEVLPSFSLGLTQVEKEAELERQRKSEEEAAQVDKGKRIIHAAEVLKSPWKIRLTRISTKINKEEQKLKDWLLTIDPEGYFLYFDTANAILDNSNCISFQPKQLVTAQVVDAFCHILNMNEMYKAEQSPLRLFVPHHVTVYVLRHSNSEEEEQHFKKFVRDFDDVLAAYDHIKFNDVDLIFFSMTVSDHHYLLCFNIKKPSFEVIDSSALQPDFDAKYQQIPQNIRNFLVRYMVLKNHSKAKDIASLVPVRLEMKWRTEHNHIDCGLFVMRHMEHYQGVSKNWDCGLAVEGKVQDQQLDVLRTRYAHQILLHECNKQKHHVEYQIFEEHMKKAELEKQKAKEKKEKDTKAPAKRQRRA